MLNNENIESNICNDEIICVPNDPAIDILNENTATNDINTNVLDQLITDSSAESSSDSGEFYFNSTSSSSLETDLSDQDDESIYIKIQKQS